MEGFYPAGPQAVPADLTRPTSAYKQRAWLALGSLGLFVVLYVALAGWFVWTAYRMLGEAVAGGPQALWNYLIGGSAAFLAVFMLKALVFLKRGGAPDAVEVTASDQPRLFEFLHRLADEGGAPRPKRVYLAARVNAAVFYDLSVLNLIFPSRKNLEIGLALVNVLTLSEIKAVLAHEFGHFAQRSMAIGSWVYIAQQIAAHIVAKRDALDKFLQSLSNLDVRIAWIGWILSLIVWSIRSLMDTLLRLVVLAQRALSRQMEFQADLVAVSLTGSDELVHALHKLHAADEAWEQTLGFAGAEINQGRIPHDLFAVHARVIERTAEILNDPDYGHAPRATGDKPEAHLVFKSSFAQPPQMWATHPANADREQNAKKRYLPAPHDARSAWVLFTGVDALKAKVTAQLVGNTKAQPATPEQTLRALEERFTRTQYNPRYRGAYLGRPVTRHAARAAELYEAVPQPADLQKAIDTLYPAQLAVDLEKSRELAEEKGTLEALHDKVYKATGDRIVHRGREISRRQLPAAIREVVREEEKVRERVTTHERRCRSVHLAAAARIGAGWAEYLRGLIGALHYAEHTLADLRDAQGAFINVLAVVTAGGKVSSGQLKRLLKAANVLHGVLAAIHAQKGDVHLDPALCTRLKVKAWADTLEEMKLPPAAKENINDWVRVVDGWVVTTAGPLSSLANAALEQMLETEEEIARCLREGKTPPAAGAPTRVPGAYPTLLPGQERKRQKRLSLWDRFQTADGVVPALARLLAAGVIVGAVLGFGSVAGTTSVLTVYNGLGVGVEVSAGKGRVPVRPFSSNQIDVQLDDTSAVEARTAAGDLIEQFKPPLSGHAQHYVYNVAGASPLVEWTATYGNAAAQPPRFLGAPQWTTSSADVLFAEPPASVRTKGGGATRTVLSGLGERAPEEVLKVLGENEAERQRVIALHAKWDHASAPHTKEWQGMAK